MPESISDERLDIGHANASAMSVNAGAQCTVVEMAKFAVEVIQELRAMRADVVTATWQQDTMADAGREGRKELAEEFKDAHYLRDYHGVKRIADELWATVQQQDLLIEEIQGSE